MVNLKASDFWRGYSGHSGFSGYSGANSSGSNLFNVYQPSHGFSVLNVVKSAGTDGTYALAQADSVNNADAVGIISEVVDPDNFVLISYGEIDNINVPAETAGTVLYLSPTTPGLLTSTEPSSYNQVSKPMAVITTSGQKMIVTNWRGVLIVDDEISRTGTWVVQSPEVATIPGPKLNADFTCIRLDGYVVGTGTADINIETRMDPNTAGTNILATDLTLDSTGVYTTTFETSDLDYGDWLVLDISAVNGTCDYIAVCLTVEES